MKRWTALLLPLMVVSCAQFAPPPRTTPPVVKPTNIIELQFEDISNPKPRARIVSAGQASPTVQTGVSKQGYLDVGSGIGVTVQNVETLTNKSTMVRHVQATFLLTNNTADTIQRLFITPVDLDDDSDPTGNATEPTIADTPFKKVRLFDGTDVPAKAADLIPGPAVIYDFQALDYVEDLEASPFLTPFDPTGFTPAVPAGLAAVNVQDYTWYLERPLESGASATVTLAVSFPVDSVPANNPFSFSMMMALGQNDEEFESVGEELNFDSDFAGAAPDITLNTSNLPVVVWSEETYYGPIHLNVAAWDGNSWNLLGYPLNNDPIQDAYTPKIAQDGTDAFAVAWQENEDIFVKQWDGSVWNSLGAALDLDPTQAAGVPDITMDGSGHPVVTWLEEDAISGVPQVLVKAWDGASWNQLGTALNVDPTQEAFQTVITRSSTGQPIVAWIEHDLIGNDLIYVRQWDGTTWNPLGTGAVNPGGVSTLQLAIASDSSDRLTLVWSDSGVLHASRWDGAGWNPMGSELNIDINNPAFSPAVSLKPDGSPVVTWSELMPFPRAVASVWSGSAWAQYSDALNYNFDQFATEPSIATDSSGTSYIAYWETSRCGCFPLVYVKSIP